MTGFCSSHRQEEVRPQDTVSVIGGVAGSSKQGRKAAWKFVRDNWEELYNRYQGGFLISRLIKVKRAAMEQQKQRFSVEWADFCSVLQLTVDGFAIDKMAAEVKVRKRRALPVCVTAVRTARVQKNVFWKV